MSEHPREHMIAHDLRARGIRDERVLAAMRAVPREAFVPAFAAHAYADRALPIAAGQTISQPYIVARMAEALAVTPTDRVLEIGTGSGYGAAVLGELGARVDTVERIAELADTARACLARLGRANVHVHVGDGTLGWPAHAPYDAVAVTAAGPSIPPSLCAQLAIGGRLVIPVGPADRQELVRVIRTGADAFTREVLLPVQFVPLIGAEGWSN